MMSIPDFIRELRSHIGTAPLWLAGATVVVLDGEGRVLLVRRRDNGLWTPVSGIVDPGEHPAETVAREAKEEAGVSIEVQRMAWLRVTDPVRYENGDRCQYLDHGFLARYLAGEARVADDESSAVGWFAVDALPEPLGPATRRMIATVCREQPEVALELVP